MIMLKDEIKYSGKWFDYIAFSQKYMIGLQIFEAYNLVYR